MSLKVTFELSDKDLGYFKNVMKMARDNSRGKGEDEIRAGASEMLKLVDSGELSDFITVRLGQLATMIQILEDDEWKLEGDDRTRVVDALAYFAEPEDLIPDRIPGLGYLDDAIMIELVAQELKHDLEAYVDFCRFREEEEKRRGTDEEPASREEWLQARRAQLHQRMRRRRERQRVSLSRRSGGKSPFSLW